MGELVEYKSPEYENAKVLIINDLEPCTKESYDLYNEKDFRKYINDIERIVRQSREYKVYIQYIRTYMDMNVSLFSPNVTNAETTKIKIEIHHTPFTLFDIVMTVFNKRSRMGESLNCFLVAKEVAYLHYFLYVGLIPLSKTEHKLVHNQSLFVPLDKVLGRYDQFIQMYRDDIPVDAMDRYNTYLSMTEHYNYKENTRILAIEPTYIKYNNNNYLGSYNNSQLLEAMNNTNNIMLSMNDKSKKAIDMNNNKYDNNTSKKLIKPITIDPKYNETQT